MRDAKCESVGFRARSGGSKKSGETVPHRQHRALLTRARLVDSARTVFARDGFELARIEDIASRAGRTRGAFYSNFHDKEDVFFAIFEEDIALDGQKLRAILHAVTTAREKRDALTAYLALLVTDRRRALLNLEFKVYAIRHPHRRKRLAELHARMRERCALPELDELLPELMQTPAGHRAGSLALTAIVDGLALNRLFDPESLRDNRIMASLRLCVEETLPLQPAPGRRPAKTRRVKPPAIGGEAAV